MATQKQIDANRRNAQLSTGPKTVEGKAASRRNALKTGIYAEYEVAPFEREEDLTHLTAEYYDRFCPTTPEQRCLVDSLINSEWLLRRFRTLEGEIMTRWGDTFECQDCQKERSAMTREMDVLQRRTNATNRHYLKALETLKALKAEEPSEQEIEDEANALPEVGQQLTDGIGFVPSKGSEAPPAGLEILRAAAPRLGIALTPPRTSASFRRSGR